VEDDGRGFDKALLKTAAGIGWNNIQNRIDFLKGRIDVQTVPGNGTSVLIEINV
jgi:signal transduction histidine kinase